MNSSILGKFPFLTSNLLLVRFWSGSVYTLQNLFLGVDKRVCRAAPATVPALGEHLFFLFLFHRSLILIDVNFYEP